MSLTSISHQLGNLSTKTPLLPPESPLLSFLKSYSKGEQGPKFAVLFFKHKCSEICIFPGKKKIQMLYILSSIQTVQHRTSQHLPTTTKLLPRACSVGCCKAGIFFFDLPFVLTFSIPAHLLNYHLK